MRNIKKYENDYLEISFEEYQVYYRKKKVIECLEKYPHESILEVGCGMSPLFFDFQDFKYMTIVEPSSLFIDYAKNKKCANNIIFKKGFIEDVSDELRNNKFDYIVVSSLLHEVENPEHLLKKIKGLCSRETVVHINVPNAFSLHRLLALEMGIIQDVYEKSNQSVKMQQNNVFDLELLLKMVEEVGFEVMEKGSYFPKYFTHKQMQELLDNEIINTSHLNGMYHMEKYFPELGSEIYVNVKLCDE